LAAVKEPGEKKYSCVVGFKWPIKKEFRMKKNIWHLVEKMKVLSENEIAQGCQMVYFQIKNPNSGIFSSVL
jgi:hypothetical protein